MTVVRRPAKMSQSCPVPGGSGFWDQLTPSRQSVIKSESARRVLEDHFNAIITESQDRTNRLARFRSELEAKCVSEEEKQALIQEFLAEESQISRLSRSRMKEARFQKIRLIGRGGFGEVYLVQDKITFEFFALKVLSKTAVILQDQISNVRTERDVLSTANNQWVVQLHASFQDAENLYLVLEYIPGGDLMTAMIKANVFPEPVARFFAGEIAIALNSIHSMNVIHRDLKLENILIGEDGHIKLTDFGLSTNYEKADDGIRMILNELQELMNEHYKLGKNRQQHVRGTEYGTFGYTAPEVLRGEGATTASDFWSLGVILFEMLFGFAPFNGKSPRETVFRVLHYKKSLRFQSSMVSPAAIDLLKHLLCEPEVRYGFMEVVSHPFFRGFDFYNVEMNIPPMVPVLLHPADTTHFDAVEECHQERESLPDDDLTKAAFLGFTYKQRPRNMTLAKLGIFT